MVRTNAFLAILNFATWAEKGGGTRGRCARRPSRFGCAGGGCALGAIGIVVADPFGLAAGRKRRLSARYAMQPRYNDSCPPEQVLGESRSIVRIYLVPQRPCA